MSIVDYTILSESVLTEVVSGIVIMATVVGSIWAANVGLRFVRHMLLDGSDVAPPRNGAHNRSYRRHMR